MQAHVQATESSDAGRDARGGSRVPVMRDVNAKVCSAVVAMVLATSVLAAQESVGTLVARARLLEESSRTLDQAVRLYERIASDRRADRPTAAAARLRIALLNERQGKTDARRLLEQVIGAYPDQPQVVSVARARVARHAAASGAQAGGVRVIQQGRSFPSAVSGDGRFAVVIANEEPSRMDLQDLRSGESTLLVAGSQTAWARTPAISRDGRLVAFSWLELDRARDSGPPVPTGQTSLKVMEAGAGQPPRTLVPAAPGYFAISPAAWSADGRRVLVHMQTRATSNDAITESTFAWVDADTAARRVVMQLEPWRDIGGGGQGQGFHGVSVSPDDRWIAYSARTREGAAERSVYVVDAEGRGEPVVISPAGTSTGPVWTADGAHVVFAHERAGERGLWAVPMVAGRPTAQARALQRDFSGWGVDVTQGNELVSIEPANVAFWQVIAHRDAGGARAVGAVEGQGAAFSRDGGRLAFLRHRRGGLDLIVRTVATGEERLYTHTGLTNTSPRWLSGESGVVVFVETFGDRGTPGGAFYKVDLASGAFTRLFARHTVSHHRSTSSALSGDGKALYLAVRAADRAPWTGIVPVDLATGTEGEVISLSTPLSGRSMPGMALSPDGRTLALQTWTDETSQFGRLITVSVEDGTMNVIHDGFAGGGWSDRVVWAPDGRWLLFVQQVQEGRDGHWRVMQVPASGGDITFDGLDSGRLPGTVTYPALETGNVAAIALSPDGKHVVFSSRALPRYSMRLLDLAGLLSAASAP
jgi:Tol biopolymer transport system component